MDKIATVGQNEAQEWIRKAAENPGGIGVGMSGAGVIGTPKEVTNDKGLVVDRVDAGGAASTTAGGGRNKIGLPNIPADKVNELLTDLEREIAFVMADNDEKTTEVEIKKANEAKKAYQISFTRKVNEVRGQVANLPDGSDPLEIIGKVFKGIGVAFSWVAAIAATVGSAGAASGLIAAATIGTLAFVADVSGGFKAMEKAISEALQKNNGMSKEDADRYASIISFAMQAVIEIVQIACSCGMNNPEQKMASFLRKATRQGIEIGQDGKIPQKIMEAAKKIAADVFKSTGKRISPEKLIKRAQELVKFQDKFKTIKSVWSVVQLGWQVGTQIDAHKREKRSGQIDSMNVRAEVNYESMQEVLSECQDSVEKAFGRRRHHMTRFADILSLHNESENKINEEFGGIGV